MTRNPIGRDVLIVAGFVLFMFGTRMRSAGNFIGDDGVLLIGNDAWYHWRTITWTIENWPRTLNFDPWTGWPTGSSIGQFGTPFDLFVGTVSWIAGLGKPSMVAAASVPPVLGALVVVPVYVLARATFDRETAIAAGLALALVPGIFFTRGLFGFLDHHVAEALLQATAVVLLAVSLRDDERLAIVGGAAATLYVFVWPPGIYLVPLMTAVVMAHSLSEFVRNGEWRRPILIVVGFVTTSATAVLAFADLTLVSQTELGRPHALMGIASVKVPLLCYVYMSWTEERGIDRRIAVGSLVLVGIICMLLFLRTSAGAFALEALRNNFLLQSSSETVAEARRMSIGRAILFALGQYGALAVFAMAGASLCLDHRRADHLVIAAWFVVSAMMALTQVRYHYYLAAPVALLAGLAAVSAARWLTYSVDVDRPEALRLAVALLLVGLAASAATGSVGTEYHPGHTEDWTEALDWLKEETDDPALDYHGEYDRVDDFDYPPGAYAVLSWWDYGHWITARAERPAVANPFQQHADEAAAYFLADGEMEAEKAVDSLGPGPDEEIRYVVVDDRMASDKFWAMARYADSDVRLADGGSPTEEYERTMVARLYDDGSGLARHRLAFETRAETVIAGVERDGELVSNRAPVDPGIADEEGVELVDPTRNSAVKVFERVDGAIVSGETDADSVVLALELRTNTGRHFTYTRQADVDGGEYEARVPYWTDSDPDESVRAVGPYRVIADGEQIAAVEVSAEDVR